MLGILLMTGQSGRADGSQAWEKVAFTIIATLIAAGVIGLWQMNGNVARLEERVSSWTQIYEKRFDAMEKNNAERFNRVDRDLQDMRGRGVR